MIIDEKTRHFFELKSKVQVVLFQELLKSNTGRRYLNIHIGVVLDTFREDFKGQVLENDFFTDVEKEELKKIMTNLNKYSSDVEKNGERK